ncbi:MAG: hypothetical protein CSA18_02510 [Deltaproteobacteria bacterium]|nr:MAG: hypothetical protein CSB21_00955 [Deltaproteobacteria bacterium]PIE75000.1 MAG: hypothetical protein CSA18_02510 [Deltaproteobacteria bacterium]
MSYILEKRIIAELCKGFFASDSIYKFAYDLGFDISFEDLKSILENKNHEINEELSALFFAPDFEIRKRFSFIPESLSINEPSPDLDYIASKTGHIDFFENEKKTILKVTRKDIFSFLTRLDLSFRIDQKIKNLISGLYRDEKNFIIASIWEKSSVLEKNRADIVFLYLERAGDIFNFSSDEFRFFINILSSWDYLKSDFTAYLLNIFKIYENAMRASMEAENFIRKNNIETFMVQGGRISFGDTSKINSKKKSILQIAKLTGLPLNLFIEEKFEIVMDKNEISAISKM